jgi:hypothetical protein
MMSLTKKQRSLISTIMGAVVAVCMAWQLVDWENFVFDFKHVFPLFLSGMVALGGYMTRINGKENGSDN